MGAAWLDYDNDGDLDLFVVNYLDWSPANNKVCGSEGRRLSCPPTDYPGLPNHLYRNDGAGRFTDVSDATGIGAQIGKGMSVAVADADGDGFIDVFVANDQTRHFLFRNVGGPRVRRDRRGGGRRLHRGRRARVRHGHRFPRPRPGRPPRSSSSPP